jgi:hypothetical protein
LNELCDIGVSAIADLYRATNRLLGAELPPRLLPDDVSHRRGRTLVSQYTAQDLLDARRLLAREKTPPDFRGFALAGMFHPLESLNHGIFVLGPTGTGKSSVFDELRFSTAPLIGRGFGNKTRFVDFDDKGGTRGKWMTILPPHIPIYYF